MQLVKSKGFQIPREATDSPVADPMLKNTPANEFDRMYVHMMVPNHRETVQAFEKYAETLVQTVGSPLYGRVTYELMKSYWPNMLNNVAASEHDRAHAAWCIPLVEAETVSVDENGEISRLMTHLFCSCPNCAVKSDLFPDGKVEAEERQAYSRRQFRSRQRATPLREPTRRPR